MTTAAFIQRLTWDTAFFGFPTGRIEALPPGEAPVQELLQRARHEGYRLLYWFIAPGDAATIRLAYEAGAQLVDDKHVYSCHLPGATPQDGGVTVAAPGQYAAQLERLALQSGEYSRFRTDPQFPAGTYERLYTHWLRQTWEKPRNQVLVYAAPDSSIVGLITLEARTEQEAAIGLLAVEAGWRQRGIGQQLVYAAQAQAYQAGFRRLRVTTQGANQAARRLYEHAGFEVLTRQYVFHLWLGG